jgi:hypothetical protein
MKVIIITMTTKHLFFLLCIHSNTKDRQKKKDKKTNNVSQNTTQKTKD